MKADPLHWEFWNKVVPGKLKEVHESGQVTVSPFSITHIHEGYSFTVVLITNQNWKNKKLAEWKEKVPLIAKKVSRLSTSPGPSSRLL